MRNIFINNYRKIVRDQTFVDQTDNLYHLNLPQDSGFESTEGAYDLKEMHRIVNALPKEYKVPFQCTYPVLNTVRSLRSWTYPSER